MRRLVFLSLSLVLITDLAYLSTLGSQSESKAVVYTGYAGQAPGRMHHITVNDLPEPYATKSVDSGSRVVQRPEGVMPKAPAGFKVELYAEGLHNPRLIRMAPNGDLFVAESYAGDIRVFRGVNAQGKPDQVSVFATGLHQPFGIAFYPSGENPQWVYVGNTDEVVRFPYQTGDLKARGSAEHIADLPGGGHLRGGGHWTRDIAFSADGKRMFVSVGSLTNVEEHNDAQAEDHRADVLEFTPDGKSERVFASGIRNCVGLATQPKTGEIWCSVNERDDLGDNLVPDYITHVQEGGFYGWPWYYIGGHQDPRHKGAHPELKDKVIVPDVLIQPHDASLEMTFYTGSQFPKEYAGNIFAAEHGSWNREPITGYEVIRVPVDAHGKASGAYEDFLTGFVTENGRVWGRPVGVTVGKDGSLFVTDDGSGSIWRVTYDPAHNARAAMPATSSRPSAR